MTDGGGSRPAPTKRTVSDLMEMCKAAGIGGCSNKRKEELIDLVVRKKPRPDAQVHS